MDEMPKKEDIIARIIEIVKKMGASDETCKTLSDELTKGGDSTTVAVKVTSSDEEGKDYPKPEDKSGDKKPNLLESLRKFPI